jgi:diguanylate cyclase (GGDEF)-like protein
MKKTTIGILLRLAVILLCSVAVLALPAYFINRNAQNTIVRELGKNAVNIATTISEFTENNIERYNKIPMSSFELVDPGSAEAPDTNTDVPPQAGGIPEPGPPVTEFQGELTGIFSTLMETTGAQNIYVMKRVSETQRAYMFKEGFQESPRYNTVPNLSENETQVFNNGVSKSSGLLADDTVGAYISGYAPIKDTNDRVVGVVAVEFSLKYAEDITNGVRNIVIFCFGAIALLATAVVNLLVVSRQKYYTKDYLTELCNKSYFEKRLRAAVRMARRKRRPLTLMMIDIDRFKNLNDGYGHQAGDTILKSISETLLRHTRDSDICARYGGDEFVILLTDTDKQQAFSVAERIRNETAQLRFPYGDTSLSVTLSIGINGLEPGMTAENLVYFTDQAMYASKSSGKNKVSILN